MSNDLEVYTPPPPPVQEAKRIIADALRRTGDDEVYATSLGKNVKRKDFLAMMLWELVTEGKTLLVDGEHLVIEDYDDWLATVKYISGHVDGAASRDGNIGVNVFKVYVGIDPDRV